MKPLPQSIAMFALSIASISLGSIFLKMGMDRFGSLTGSGVPAFSAVLRSPQLPAGVVLMAAQFFSTLLLFKWGWDASVVIPVQGLCYVGTAILGKWLLNEPVNGLRWLGIGLIIAGVFCVARSAGTARMP